MEHFQFSEDLAIRPEDRLLEGVSISPLTSPMASGGTFQVAIFRIEPGGGIRRHPASTPQIIAVVRGIGEVAGGDGVFRQVKEGDGVFFARGEEHETRSKEGMTAIIVEGESLRPFGWRDSE